MAAAAIASWGWGGKVMVAMIVVAVMVATVVG
jgi:hypothetical protein